MQIQLMSDVLLELPQKPREKDSLPRKSLTLIVWRMSCPSTGPKMFFASTNCLGPTKNWIDFCATRKKSCAGTKIEFTKWKWSLGFAQNFFGMAWNIWTKPKCFGTVEGQGRSLLKFIYHSFDWKMGDFLFHHKFFLLRVTWSESFDLNTQIIFEDFLC